MKRANHVGLMLAMVKGKTYKQIREGIIHLDGLFLLIRNIIVLFFKNYFLIFFFFFF